MTESEPKRGSHGYELYIHASAVDSVVDNGQRLSTVQKRSRSRLWDQPECLHQKHRVARQRSSGASASRSTAKHRRQLGGLGPWRVPSLQLHCGSAPPEAMHELSGEKAPDGTQVARPERVRSSSQVRASHSRVLKDRAGRAFTPDYWGAPPHEG